MNFIENIVVNEITHVGIVNFKSHERLKMSTRPWHGIAFSLGGELIYRYCGREIKLSERSMVYLPQYAVYDIACIKGGAFAIINFKTANELEIQDFLEMDMGNADAIQRAFFKMRNAFASDAENKTYSCFSSLYEIFSLLSAPRPSKEKPTALKRAVRYIESNIASAKLCNEDVAQNIGISEVYLRKLFSQHLSVSVNRYMQNVRMEKAKRLLVETGLSVTEISEECGYSSIYYFCNSFKRNTGYTPTEYRSEYSYSLL